MRLTRLELSGFKSFAGAVELPFEAGVTAIVGPNGCGKSNISDAVRWVLGEQSPRLLRGGKMEDVIFQGSTGRRPVNVAEVSLVFDNTDGTLPIASQEVLVTRRLSRSGQSEYLLNRSPVRLRDIQDLLRGTGLGGLGQRAEQLAATLPAERAKVADAEQAREAEVQARHTAEARRTDVERRLNEARLEVGRLEGDLALAAERLRNAGQRRTTAGRRREQEAGRAQQTERERAAAEAERAAAERDLGSVGQELAGRTALEQEVRDRLVAQRNAVRELEEAVQRLAEAFRALEIERAALERERGELGQQLAHASQERAARADAEWAATAAVGTRAQQAAALELAAAEAAEHLERARRQVAALKEQETHNRATRRQA